MIIVKLHGGLGNQMFQYAFARKLAWREETKLTLDISGYISNGPRAFSLNDFNVSYDKLIGNEKAVRLRKALGGYKTLKNIFFFDEKNAQARGNLYLDGFWESFKYTEDVTARILREFTLKNPSGSFLQYAKKIKPDSISVHVRRGDYLVPHGKFLNGRDYYEKAVALVTEKRKLVKPVVTIFSDDPEWCRKEFSTLAGLPSRVFEDKSVSDAEELILMSLHSHNVMSNSTFSWWAAYLNQNKDKIVIVPKDWFTDPKLNERYTAEITPVGWFVA